MKEKFKKLSIFLMILYQESPGRPVFVFESASLTPCIKVVYVVCYMVWQGFIKISMSKDTTTPHNVGIAISASHSDMINGNL